MEQLVKEKADLQNKIRLMEEHLSMYKSRLYEERYDLFVKKLRNIESQINM